MAQISEEKENHEKEKVSNSNLKSSPNSKNSEEKKTEAEVTVTLSDLEQEQEEEKDPMEMNVEEENEQDSFSPTPGTVFQICLEQPAVYSLHKMNYPQVCRNFSVVAWCGKLNAIACASEACISDPSSILSPTLLDPCAYYDP
ncbi:hypothetical protein RYX36_018714 [Vicia faba]